MTAQSSPQSLPLVLSYNLARLGNTGDLVTLAADEAQCAAIAKWSGILGLESFEAKIQITKLAVSRFGLAYQLTADVIQACVVTLEPVKSRLDHRFNRELHFTGPTRHKPAPDDDSGSVVVLAAEEEGPEEIESLHYDLAGPLLEEFILSLEPYPRCPGVEFSPQTDALEPPPNPFAVLKGLK
jgi:uncharacterized metal-binding protein YceD (DUF177 family)